MTICDRYMSYYLFILENSLFYYWPFHGNIRTIGFALNLRLPFNEFTSIFHRQFVILVFFVSVKPSIFPFPKRELPHIEGSSVNQRHQ